ncbi:alginate export family protein [Sphingomonas sp. CFBP 8765]|uniref:alginate export family protein n=1 Tax=unclassified Sphingomonas TaxID=196159 RepID=UPI001782EB9B|nr:alginate export family protein [Sphingomonas sp. CFBP 8765]MBD8470226.1 alginate export family protein [Sphingomonas sp. CFBP 8765]
MKRLVLTGVLLASAAPAVAQTVTLAPVVDARLRYETVDQDRIADDADAVTMRVRAGVQATRGHWSALAEAQANLAIVGNYYDGLHGSATRPLVADPQSVGLYLAQVQYRTPAVAITAGRQRIALDDERFVGSAPFRQNAQTYDAVRIEWTAVKNLKADVTYAWDVRTIWGIDGVGARQQGIAGNNVFANLGYKTAIGTATGFAYLIDQDEAAVQGYRLSSQTYGVRFAGAQALGGAKLAYQASYARQSDWHRNPNRYAADYYLADLALDLNGPKLGAGYEVLGASGGGALTSFQTPLSSLFKFQGWADKFLTTPADGVRDAYASAGWGWKMIGVLQGVSLQGVYHRFESDRLVRHYGNEVDLLASAKLGRTTATLRYADYDADLFAVDTRKFWLQLDWAI